MHDLLIRDPADPETPRGAPGQTLARRAEMEAVLRPSVGEDWRSAARRYILQQHAPRTPRTDAVMALFRRSHFSLANFLVKTLGMRTEDLVPSTFLLETEPAARYFSMGTGTAPGERDDRVVLLSHRLLKSYLTILTTTLVGEMVPIRPPTQDDVTTSSPSPCAPIREMTDLLLECRRRAASVRNRLFNLNRQLYSERAATYGSRKDHLERTHSREHHQQQQQQQNPQQQPSSLAPRVDSGQSELMDRLLDSVIHVPKSLSSNSLPQISSFVSGTGSAAPASAVEMGTANSHVEVFFADGWLLLLRTIGMERMRILMQDVCMFEQISSESCSYMQISGMPLSDWISLVRRKPYIKAAGPVPTPLTVSAHGTSFNEEQDTAARSGRASGFSRANASSPVSVPKWLEREKTKGAHLPRSLLFCAEAPKPHHSKTHVNAVRVDLLGTLASRSSSMGLLACFPPTNNGARALLATLFGLPISRKTPRDRSGDARMTEDANVRKSASGVMYSSSSEKRRAKLERRRLRREMAPSVTLGRQEEPNESKRRNDDVVSKPDMRLWVNPLGAFSASRHIPIPRQLRPLISVLREVLDRFHKSKFEWLLRCTRVPKALTHHWMSSEHGDPPIPEAQLALYLQLGHVSKNEVAQGIIRTLLAVFPRDVVWGTRSNVEQAAQIATRYILMRRFETLVQDQLLHGFRLSKIPWLCGVKRETQSKSLIFRRFLRFMLVEFMLPVIRYYFYVTDAETEQSSIRFYPHVVWSRITKLGLQMWAGQSRQREITDDALESKQQAESMPLHLIPLYRPVKRTEAQQLLESRWASASLDNNETLPPLGYSTARFKPKRRELRPLVNMARGSSYHSPEFDRKISFRSANVALRPVFETLRGLAGYLSLVRGSHVQGSVQIHEKLKEFVGKLKALKGPLSIHICTLDLQRCYDNIPRDRLLMILRRVFAMVMQFVQVRYSLINFTAASVMIRHQRLMLPTGKATAPLRDMAQYSFRSLLKTSPQAVGLNCSGAFTGLRKPQSFYVETRDSRRTISTEPILGQLLEHVERNLIRIGGNFYLQTRGVPQGSCLSALLANIYISAVEASSLAPLLQQVTDTGHQILAMRQMDDFICLSTSKTACENFMNLLSSSNMRRVGLIVNPSKSMTTYSPNNSEETPQTPSSSRLLSSTTAAKWNGLLLHVRSGVDDTWGASEDVRSKYRITLCVTADMTRVINTDLRDSMAMRYGSHTLQQQTSKNRLSHLGRMLVRTLIPRAVPMLYDENVQYVETTSHDLAKYVQRSIVALNVYQLFVLLGFRFLAICHELSDAIIVRSSRDVYCPQQPREQPSDEAKNKNHNNVNKSEGGRIVRTVDEIFLGLGASPRPQKIRFDTANLADKGDTTGEAINSTSHHAWAVARRVLVAFFEAIEFFVGALASKLSIAGDSNNRHPPRSTLRVAKLGHCPLTKPQLRFLGLRALRDVLLQLSPSGTLLQKNIANIPGTTLAWSLILSSIEVITAPVPPVRYLIHGTGYLKADVLARSILASLDKHQRNRVLLRIRRSRPKSSSSQGVVSPSTTSTISGSKMLTPSPLGTKRSRATTPDARTGARPKLDRVAATAHGTRQQEPLVQTLGETLLEVCALLPKLRKESALLFETIRY